MENTSYALIVAASTLIAVVIIAVAAFVFNNLGIFQQSQEDLVKRENITEFNRSFEAYNKSLMYGTDVLSCLNLAENNNQKYVYEVYQGDDNSTISYTARDQLLVDVYVTINSSLIEKMQVYSRYESNGATKQMTSSDGKFNFRNDYITVLFSNDNLGLFKIPDVSYYYFAQEEQDEGNHGSKVRKNTEAYKDLVGGATTMTELKVNTNIETNFAGGTYSLVSYDDSKKERTDTAKLIALLSITTESEQTVYNEGYDNTENAPDGWTYATWITAVSDFKTRKFECTNLEYNAETGYVSKLEFKEITNDD